MPDGTFSKFDIKHVRRKEPGENVWKVHEPSVSKQTNQISSSPVKPAGYSSRLLIGPSGDT